MKLELHLLQNFPPSCLNRDDTNSPKDCEFGGVRRARISSQSLKRAIRQDFKQPARLDLPAMAVRTKRIVQQVVANLQEKRDPATAERIVELLLASIGLGVSKKEGADSKTEYLLFIPQKKIQNLAALVDDKWDALAKIGESKAEKKGTGKAKKKDVDEAPDAVSAELRKEVEALVFDTKHTPEISLFGRMIADKPEHNVDASCQVAHAISTHRVAMEFDFFTAVDDLKPRSDSGADMMGTIQFNSACFYRYSVLDLAQLARSLAGLESNQALKPENKAEAASVAVKWLEASVAAIPSARQNSFAAFTPPQVILVGSRKSGGPQSLANAFVQPVRPGAGEGEDLISKSAKAMDAHLGDLQQLFGKTGASYMAASTPNIKLDNAEKAESFGALIEATKKSLDAWASAA